MTPYRENEHQTQQQSSKPGPRRYAQPAYAALACIFWRFILDRCSRRDCSTMPTARMPSRAEMLVSGDYVTLHVNGVRYLEKAPLPYWLVAFSYAFWG